VAQGYKIHGLDRLQKKLERLPAQIKQAVIEDIQDAADTITIKAINRVPVDFGVLKQSIGNEPKNGGLNYIIFVSAEYAPYVEFGRGTAAEIPDGLEEYAAQFKGQGQKLVNFPAQPFFFNSYFEERDKLIKTLKSSIAKYL